MLTITPQAADMIGKLVGQARLPLGAGLRIAAREDSPGLRMAFAEAPRRGDRVLTQREVTVFLDDRATHRLRDEVLDARANQTGQAFFLRP